MTPIARLEPMPITPPEPHSIANMKMNSDFETRAARDRGTRTHSDCETGTDADYAAGAAIDCDTEVNSDFETRAARDRGTGAYNSNCETRADAEVTSDQSGSAAHRKGCRDRSRRFPLCGLQRPVSDTRRTAKAIRRSASHCSQRNSRRGRYFKDDALRTFSSRFLWYQPHAWDVPLARLNKPTSNSFNLSSKLRRHPGGL